ncbi:MAG TPA: DNA-formamidopyrimidine glycosylase family protein [Myxococcales bacterium]|nr:DNA-formamidopyrimidine glycosylase family protein [Myxococcales bacterium]
MPELPDITAYIEALEPRVLRQPVQAVRLASPFVLRTFDPPISEAIGKQVVGIHRIGKRIALELEGDLFLVFHLMIAGRLRWLDRGAKMPGKLGLAAIDFPYGTLLFTEAATKKRASLHLVRGKEAVRAMDRGGIEVLDAPLEAFREALLRENHTLKRALTDPRLFSGIGNAYSDEILHRARLSPVQTTNKLSGDEIARLHRATQDVLREWIDRLRDEAKGEFPEKVTAFREGMAVHGRFRKPCPVCGTAVQRIAYADNETNYCPRCQTEGRILSDRSLSRLLKSDWPKSIEELEEKMPARAPRAE